jgi:hypothetical protein
VHQDLTGCEHQRFAQGLNKAVYNFMHGIGTDLSVSDWFDFQVPKISIKRNYVEQALNEKPVSDKERLKSRVLWLENRPVYTQGDQAKKARGAGKSVFIFYNRTEKVAVTADAEIGEWLNKLFEGFLIQNPELMLLEELKQQYEKHFSSSFEPFLRSPEWKVLREKGLLLI